MTIKSNSKINHFYFVSMYFYVPTNAKYFLDLKLPFKYGNILENNHVEVYNRNMVKDDH